VSGLARELARELLRYDVVIFDADDTLRTTLVAGQPCPHRSDEWALLPDVAAALRPLPWGDRLRLGIASNQDRVGWGLIDQRSAHAMLRALAVAATGHDPGPEAVLLCPHRPDERCGCRKPEAGLLRRILLHYEVPPARAVFVGDAATDREAAARAGTGFLWRDRVFGPPYVYRRTMRPQNSANASTSFGGLV
jgi:D-glycero-D-manno-heptose 1,7-bisphosphate phosphatase